MDIATSGGQTFRSKVDGWLFFVVAGGIGALWLAPVQRIWAGRTIDGLDMIVPAAATAFIVWIFTTTYYVVTADALIVRAGPIRRTIPLRLVERLTATRNPLSSPALSLDRIDVMYGGRHILISPHDKREFVRAVRARAPGVALDGLSAN